VNVILLWSEAVARGFASPIWMTFKQAIELGGHVRKGETGSTVVYASRFMKTETDGNGDEVERDIPFLKAYTVFCVDQIDDLHEHYYGRPTAVPSPIERNAHADAFLANTGAIVRHGGTSAFDAPSSDHIQMPPIESFRDTASYVAVRAHETVHWTAPSHRVNRDLSRYSSMSYRTTSASFSRPPHMRSVPSPTCTTFNRRPPTSGRRRDERGASRSPSAPAGPCIRRPSAATPDSCRLSVAIAPYYSRRLSRPES
jgi:antirestriction protein ArdC